MDLLAELTQSAGIALTPLQRDRFASYSQLLKDWQPKVNLVASVAEEDLVHRHFFDCIMAQSLVTINGPLLDLGSGAGFPGVVFQIMKPDLPVCLAEPRKKRVAFLEAVVKELGLTNTQVYPKKIVPGILPMPVESVVTRAVESIEATLKRAAEFLPPGGSAYFMKGPKVDEELAALSLEPLGFVQNDDLAYALPAINRSRRLLVFQKE